MYNEGKPDLLKREGVSITRFQTTLTEARIKKYTDKGYWGTNTLLDYFEGSVKLYPDKTTVADAQGRRLTYSQLDNLSSKLAHSLFEMGIRSGQVVSVQLPNWTEFAIILVALLRLGAVINPVQPNFREKELEYVLNKSRSSLLFIPDQFRGHDYPQMVKKVWPRCAKLQNVIVVGNRTVCNMIQLNDLVDNGVPFKYGENLKSNANDVVIIFFTSGTESRPKGIMHTHNTVIFGEKALSRVLGLSEKDIIFMPSTVAHATGCLHGVCLPIINGGQSVLLDIFSPEKALDMIEQEHCSFGMGATPFVHDILHHEHLYKYDMSSLRFFLCGGAPIPRKLAQNAFRAGFKLLAVYGSDESPPHTVSRLDDTPEKIFGSDGVPLPGIEVMVVDENRMPLEHGKEGEEASRGPNVCVGYLDEPELTAESFDKEGWYYAGELCMLDSEGYIRIVGRKKDIIVRGGENISCREVEDLLYDHPDIEEAVIVAMPDEHLGERICAYVVLNTNRKLSLMEIQKHMADHGVAKNKWPEELVTVDKFQQ